MSHTATDFDAGLRWAALQLWVQAQLHENENISIFAAAMGYILWGQAGLPRDEFPVAGKKHYEAFLAARDSQCDYVAPASP